MYYVIVVVRLMWFWYMAFCYQVCCRLHIACTITDRSELATAHAQLRVAQSRTHNRQTQFNVHAKCFAQ